MPIRWILQESLSILTGCPEQASCQAMLPGGESPGIARFGAFT